jgi:hypothetical protein
MDSDDELAPSRGVILGTVFGLAGWALFFWIVWQLMNLPGLP